jgi:hypothetical protein
MSQAGIPPLDLDETWRNDPQAAADAAKILRLPATSPEMERLTVCAVAAGNHICQFLDRTEPIPGVIPGDPPATLRYAHSNVTVELYRRKDTPFGVMGGWNADDGGATHISPDPLAGVKFLIMPYRARWGLA